jgi:hypothetical protein
MQLQTPVDIPRPPFALSHRERVLLLGSCFADEVGARLVRDGFDCRVNPYGVLYNPASIAAHLYRCMSRKAYAPTSPELFHAESDGLWHSWMHHTDWSAAQPDALVERMNATMNDTADFLSSAHVLIVTLGTSYIYRLAADGRLVSNCHKQPDALFRRTRLSAVDIVDTWTQLLQLLTAMHPQLRVVFTVSPIRHRRDGLHENQLSKAELLVAADALCRRFETLTAYFPSYEILLDELRDYRFYAPDMLHPSAQAVDYIYERFEQAYVPPAEQAVSRDVRKLRAALAHRPMHPGSAAWQQFADRLRDDLQQLSATYPHLRFGDESIQSLCNTPLNK